MGYRLSYQVSIDFVPDGAGPMSVPTGPTLQFNNVPYAVSSVVVPGGNTPTLANFNTALCGTTPSSGSAMFDISAQISAQLARIQAFATGGG